MHHPRVPRRGEAQGNLEWAAEQLAGEIRGGHVAEQLRAQLAPEERLAVGMDRDLLVSATVDVVEHRSRQLPLGHGAEVVGHVDPAEQPLDGVALEAAQLDELEDLAGVHRRVAYSVLVMAPVSAPCTNLAYLPSTPLV